MQPFQHIEKNYHFCFPDLLSLFFFFIQFEESIYESPHLKFILQCLLYNSLTEWKIKPLLTLMFLNHISNFKEVTRKIHQQYYLHCHKLKILYSCSLSALYALHRHV